MAEGMDVESVKPSTFQIRLYVSSNTNAHSVEKSDRQLNIVENHYLEVEGASSMKILLQNLQYVGSSTKFLDASETLVLSYWDNDSNTVRHVLFEVVDQIQDCKDALMKFFSFKYRGSEATPIRTDVDKAMEILKTQPAVLRFLDVKIRPCEEKEETELVSSELMADAEQFVAVLDIEGFFLYKDNLQEPKYRLLFLEEETADSVEKVAQLQSHRTTTYVSLYTKTHSFVAVGSFNLSDTSSQECS